MYLSFYLATHLSTYMFIHLSIYLYLSSYYLSWHKRIQELINFSLNLSKHSCWPSNFSFIHCEVDTMVVLVEWCEGGPRESPVLEIGATRNKPQHLQITEPPFLRKLHIASEYKGIKAFISLITKQRNNCIFNNHFNHLYRFLSYMWICRSSKCALTSKTNISINYLWQEF